jgi:hypothetical protein
LFGAPQGAVNASNCHIRRSYETVVWKEPSGFSHILVNYETNPRVIIYGPVLTHIGLYIFFFTVLLSSPSRTPLQHDAPRYLRNCYRLINNKAFIRCVAGEVKMASRVKKTTTHCQNLNAEEQVWDRSWLTIVQTRCLWVILQHTEWPTIPSVQNMYKDITSNSVVWVCVRTIPTERPPFVGEVTANVCL